MENISQLVFTLKLLSNMHIWVTCIDVPNTKIQYVLHSKEYSFSLQSNDLLQ